MAAAAWGSDVESIQKDGDEGDGMLGWAGGHRAWFH